MKHLIRFEKALKYFKNQSQSHEEEEQEAKIKILKYLLQKSIDNIIEIFRDDEN